MYPGSDPEDLTIHPNTLKSIFHSKYKNTSNIFLCTFLLYFNIDINIDKMDRIYVDEETGESISLPASDCEIRQLVSSINNAETGEPEINVVGIETIKRRIRFQVMISNNFHKIHTIISFFHEIITNIMIHNYDLLHNSMYYINK